MKKTLLLFTLLLIVIFFFSGVINGTVKDTRYFAHYKTFISKDQNTTKITLVFRVAGLHSEADALVVDEILKKKSFVLSVSTDFKTGLCKVVTDNIDNKDKIRESICSAQIKIGNKITAELLDSPVEQKNKPSITK